MARTTIATDDFNRADGALGANWTNLVPGSTSTPLVESNRVSGSTFGVVSCYPCSVWSGSGTFTNDHYSQVTIGGVSLNDDTFRSGVILRAGTATDGSRNYYQCTLSLDPGAGSWRLRISKVVNGTLTELANATTAFSSGDLLLAEVVGTTINVYRTDFTTVLLTTTDATHSTGKPGLLAACGYASGVGYVDSWEGGSVTGGTAFVPRRKLLLGVG
jgi:hypothetical protein